jgi:sugar phosphate isomerase/epimerase
MSWSIGISTGACMARPILDVLEPLVHSGVRGVELGTPPRHFDPWQDGQVLALAERLQETSLQAISIHAPFGGLLDLADPNPHHRHAAIGAILTAARAIKRLGGHIVVVHPSDIQRNGTDVDARLHDCAASLLSLSESCRQEGLTLAIESPLPHLIGGHPDEFSWVLRHLDHSAGVCLDTGHTTLGHHWHHFLEISGTRLVHVHASDNNGQYDDHLPPGDGCINWHTVGQSLEAVGFNGWVMLELRCPEGDLAAYFRRVRARAVALLGEREGGCGTPGETA